MELVILLLVLLPLVLVLYYQNQRSSAKRKLLQPPGPKGLPFIGILHQFDGLSPHTFLHRLSQKYGPIASFKLGYRPVIVISSADIVQEVMKSHDLAFSGRPMLLGLRKLSYDGLDVAFSSYSDSWRERRKICTLQLFSVKQLQSFRPVREQEVSWMIDKIAKDANSCKITDLSKITVTVACNTTCLIALGKRYGETNTFMDLLHETQAVMGGFYVGDYLPSLGWIDTISGIRARLNKTFRDLDCFYQEIIDEHLDPNKPKAMEGDIVDLLLGMKSDGLPSMDLNVEHIKAILMNILAGGTDTASAVVTWAMTALMKNPVVMKKVQTEIRESVETKYLIDEDDIAKLAYFKAVVKETFRLYLPAPLLVPRETIEKCIIHGYEIQPGTMVYVNAWAIARDPGNWNDPDEFIPERFLKSEIDIRGRDPKVIPFGTGRRGCLAVSTGIAMVEIMLANLLHAFDWEFPVGMTKEELDFDVLPGLTMHKKNALCLVAKSVH